MFFMSSYFSFSCFIAKQELKVLERMFKSYLIFLSCFMCAKYQFQLSTRSKTKLLGVSPARIIGITGKIDKLWGVQAGPLSAKKHV